MLSVILYTGLLLVTATRVLDQICTVHARMKRLLPAGAFVACLGAGALGRRRVVAATLSVDIDVSISHCRRASGLVTHGVGLLRSVVGAVLTFALALCARAPGAAGATSPSPNVQSLDCQNQP